PGRTGTSPVGKSSQTRSFGVSGTALRRRYPMSEPKKPTVLLEHYLKKLKLPTILREYASMAAVCRDDRSDYPTYLLRLTERELLDRETRAAERRVKDARFPVTKTIDTFDFKASRLSTSLWSESSCGENSSTKGKTSCSSATAVPARHTWPVPWHSQHACKATGSVSPQSPVWSPSFWRVGKTERSGDFTSSWNVNISWCWTN